MDVNGRQKSTLNHLLSARDYVTAGELATRLGVSVRTIYRDIAAINAVAPVVVNAPGKGIRIDYEAFTAEAERLAKGKGSRGLSIEARRRSILLMLLVSAPQPRSVLEFSEAFHVGTSSIQKDLAHVARLAAEKGLALTADSKGTRLVGVEGDIRDAIADVMVPLIVRDGTMPDEAGSELEFLRSQGIFSESDLDRIAEAIGAVEEKYSLHLENPYYINLVTHLLIVVERIRRARNNGEPADSLPDTRARRASMRDRALAAAAVDLLRHLESALDLAIPHWEASHVYAFLQGSDSRPEEAADADLEGEAPADDALPFTAELIGRVSTALGLPLTDDRKLLDKLVLHVKPMLFRTAHGVQIRNPILDDVRHQFPDLLALVVASLGGLEADRGLNRSSESEAAYLVLYFQQALDRARRQLRVVVVCSTGRGTALFLRSRIERRFPDWHIVELVGVRDLERVVARINLASDIDLVISTIPLDGLPIPTAVVNSLLTPLDVDILIANAAKVGWVPS